MSASAGVNATIVGSPTISFYNDGKYIRVENGNTGVTSYFNKSNLTFQADADTSFFLKSDTLQTYYLFADVVRPIAANVKALLEIFQSWIEDADANEEASPFISDTTTTVLEVKTFYDKDPLRIGELVAGDATSTHDAGKNAVIMDITDSATSRIVRQTKPYASIINNKTMYAVVSSVLLTDTTALNVISKAGCFDDNADITLSGAMSSGNGVFFQYKSGEGLALVLRTNITGSQVDTVVLQTSWNVDTMNGLGSGGKTLDPTVENTFVFEWSALKGSSIRAGYMQDGQPMWCHRFLNVRMGCASVPLRWELGRLDAEAAQSSAATSIQGAASVMIMGNNDGPLVHRAKTNTAVKAVTLGNSPLPILSMRLRPATNRAKALPKRLRVMNLDQGVAKWSLVLNASSLTGASFNDIGDGSYVQFSEDETAMGSGVVIASGFFSEVDLQAIELNDKNVALCADIAGNPDVLTLAVQYLRGVVTVSASIEWAELE